MELNVDTSTVEQPSINIDTGTAPSAPPSDEVAKTRAYKAHMGVGDIIKQGYDEIYRNIADGQEDALRKDASLEITNQAIQNRQQQLVTLAAQKGSNLTLGDVTALDVQPSNPKTVLEQSYSRAYVNTVNDSAARIEDNILTEAQSQDPDAVASYMNKGSDILSKREYALTQVQNLQPNVDANKWFSIENKPGTPFSFGMEDLKQLASVGLRDEFMLRGVAAKTSRLSGGFLGENIDNQVSELLDLPFEEFTKKIDDIKSTLSPELAQKFINYIASMSTRDKYIMDAMSAGNLAIAAGVVKGGRDILQGVGERQVSALGRRATAATDQGGLVRGEDGVYRRPAAGSTELTVVQAQKAVEDVVKSAAAPEVTKSSIAEGAGDVKEAAVQKTVTSVTKPDPTKDGLDTLLSLHRSDRTELENNPGNLSREDHTRLLDAAAGFEKNTVDVLVNSSRVMRLPLLAEEGFRSIADKIKDYFPGRENTIMDIDVRYEPISNTHWFDAKVGNYDGTPFSNYDLAVTHARLHGYPLEGIEGKAGDRVYLPAAALKNLESVKTTPEGTKFYVNHGVEVVPHANPQDGLVPYNLKTGKFESTVGSKRLYIPAAAAKDLESVQTTPEGTKFFVTHGIEVEHSEHPEPGFIPYNLETNKFEPALSQTARIEQQGLGFHVVVSKPLNETEPFVRSGLIGDTKAMSTSNEATGRVRQAANAILGYVRNPYDTLSRVENENRAKTVFGQTRFIELVKQEISSVEDIYKGMLGQKGVLIEKPLSYLRMPTGANRIVADQFTRALEVAQTAPDPKTALPGYYMKSPAEIQHFWEMNFGRPASLKEQQAYLAVGRIDHFDHILRAVESFKYKARLGVEQWTFNTSKDGVLIPSKTFEASQLKRVPGNTDDVMLIHDSDGTERYFHSMGTKAQQDFREAVAEGRYLGVEIFDPEKRPLNRQDVRGNNLRVRYVFSNAFERKPMTFDQLGYRGGGHWQYDYEHAVKQSIVRPQRVGSQLQHIYEGDSTFGFVGNRVEGEAFAKGMNEVARLVRARQYKDARDYAKTVFDIEWKDLYKGFRPSKNPVTGEVLPPRFSTDPRQEFRVVPKGRTIKDLDSKLQDKYVKIHPKTQATTDTFVDGTRHGSLARNFQTEYTQPRDSYALNEFVNSGSVDKPFYNFRPAKLTDPITTMTRAVNRIVNSTYMNDMKITAVEHWLEENKGLIDATLKEIRSSPFHYFNEGKFKNNPDAALQRLNAESNRYKIKQLLGMPSKIDSAVHGVKQALSDIRYEARTTTQKVVRAPLIAPEWMLDHIHHPVDFLRGMTFHLNLGLFAIKQVVVQSMAYTTIYGLAGPLKATQGSFAAWMHQWSRINKNPAIIAKMDQLATSFGWRLGEFTEAMKILDRTGFGHVGHEMSVDNGLHKQSFFRNDGKGILDAGQRPFNEGNLHVRFGSWYTAFKEFRDKNPYLKIGPVEEGQILYRANYLNTTMTRDANTVLNKGLIGVPFQFYDYMKKMADTFWSKNIGETPAQRAYVRLRMFTMYAMLGGIAGATGVSGLPFGDIIRKNALSGDLPLQTEPYVPGAHLWSTMIMEGPTSTLVNELTGHFYNFNNRYNPNGLQVFRDVAQTDPSFWKILLGATGTTVGNEISSLSGFANAMYSMIEGNPAREAWPLKVDDWIAPLKNIRTWSDGERLMYALQYGKWLDSHGAPTSDVSKTDAVWRTLTGLADQRVDDMYIMRLSKKDQKAVFDKGANEFIEQARLADHAAANNDPQQANDYWKRAFFALKSRGVPDEMLPQIFSRVATENKDTIEKNNESYYLKFVPKDKQEAYRQAYKQTQKAK